ncbi:tetratricopeptide repeat protein [Aquibium sp. ELW1220]|uniref:tetratricopeptide repeat protein n=1 Tax=Aquibium sp. ELW1220 TaxID=2976766 RepID=UPI0025AF932E|nr:tetratricopeptide repeat protein [Aquibium sp. ELW1220]MDN2583833.1 tetratricopeptide repeat protein [Aquibium sp. ELW1220]
MARSKRKMGLQQEAEPSSVLRRLADRLSLPGLESWSSNVRTVLFNLFFLILVIILVPLLIGQFRRDQVIIEPIAVPEALAARGLSADVAASRIWDGLSDVTRAARTSKETIVALPDNRRVEFSFPDSGVSIESLVFHVRRLFNAYETRIAGEFVCGTAECTPETVSLRLRVVRDGVDVIDLPPMGERTERAYFADAASGILAVLDPFVAIGAAAETEPLKATILARRLIRSHHEDAKWAHNLIGLIRYNAGDATAAMTEFRAAIALDPAFLPARNNLGNALLKAGDLAGARAEFEAVRARDAGNVHASEGFAELALAAGDAAAAVRHYLEAAERDPVDPRYFTKAGRIELAAGRTAEGIALLTRALELDPGYLLAFAELAAMHLAKGDYPAAEKIYRDAADYAPGDPEAQMAHGRILAILKQWEAAVVRVKRAAELDPGNAGYRLQWAIGLHRLGRLEEALALLIEAESLAPADPDIQMSIGDVYRDLGRMQQAVAAYRKFLELAAADAVMRPVAERFIALLSAKG